MLNYRLDPLNPDGHGFVEPVALMLTEQYEVALAATRSAWQPVDGPGDVR